MRIASPALGLTQRWKIAKGGKRLLGKTCTSVVFIPLGLIR